MSIQQHIEALIFTAEQAITADELITCVKTALAEDITKPELAVIINSLKSKYQQGDYAFEIVEYGDGYQFLSKPIFESTISVLLQQRAKKRLSTAALETLAIIAYKQPITKADMEAIRGVNCDYSVQKLLEKDLIEMSGKSDGPGRPVLYSTSKTFMDYFGIKSVKDLPQLKDIMVEHSNEIGAPIE